MTSNHEFKQMPDVDNVLIHNVIFELQQFLHQEINIIETELNRTRVIVEEAVVDISSSFKDLQSLTINQQTLIQNSVENNNTDIINTLAAISPKIAHAASKGVRSLQFEDLVRQSLESLEANIKSIHEVSNVLRGLEHDKNTPVHDQLVTLKERCQKIYHQTKEAESARRVKQLTMDEGDIDLF